VRLTCASPPFTARFKGALGRVVSGAGGGDGAVTLNDASALAVDVLAVTVVGPL
jgi:hypothetical protein